MTRYFISFNDGDMTFPEEDLPAVGAAAHAVMAEAIEAGHWVFGGGFLGYSPRVVTAEGAVTEGPLIDSNAHIGGFAIRGRRARTVAVANSACEWRPCL